MKLAIAQLNPRVGDLDGNTARALSAAEEAASQDADIIAFPAHVLTGAPLGGLAASAAFMADVQAHLEFFAQETPIPALVSCMVIATPDDDDDDDDDAGVSLPALFMANGGEVELVMIPELQEDDECLVMEIAGERLAVLHEEHFAPEAELAGINVLLEMSADAYGEPTACPAAWGQLERTSSVAATCHSFLADVNLCGAADTMVFAGGSTVTGPDGALMYAAPLDSEEVFVFDTYLGSGQSRPSIDSVKMNPNEILWRGIVTATRDYMLKNGFSDVVVGLSGGIDSAVVACVAADALGGEHVHGVLMPGEFSSEGSVADAKALAENLGIDTVMVAIPEVVESFHDALAEACGGSVSGIAAENLQARIRATYLMTISNSRGWIVLNTGNKSEAAMGFSTLGGDTCGVFAPIGDLYKSDVYDLARWRAEQGASIPAESIEKPPSAELHPDQLDQDRLPPYDALDDLLFDHVEGNMDAGELVHEGHDRAMVAQVLKTVRRNEFKRRLEPMAPKVTGKSFTAERAWPVTNAWVDDSFDAFVGE